MIHAVPFSHFSDYKAENLPSVIYDPQLREVSAKIHHAEEKKDFSFSIKDDDGKPLAHCLLYRDDLSEKKQFWALGAPATCWLTTHCPQGETRIAVFKTLLRTFKKCINGHPGTTLYFCDFFQEHAMNPISEYLLQKESCVAELSFSHRVELTNSIEMLHASLRERYKSTINKGTKKFSFSVIDSKNIQEPHIGALHECHITASGRDVYSSAFWNLWLDQIRKGNAFLVMAQDGRKVCGAALYTISRESVYYGIGAFDRSLNKTGLSHSCMWHAICYSHKCGFRYFEVGRTDFSPLHPDITEKEMNIGFFKRGFGGTNRPVLYLSTQLP